MRVTGVRGGEVDVEWVDPPRALLKSLSRYLLAGDEALTPATLRHGGLAVGSVEHAVTYDYASSAEDVDAILALRLHRAPGRGPPRRSDARGHALAL